VLGYVGNKIESEQPYRGQVRRPALRSGPEGFAVVSDRIKGCYPVIGTKNP